MSAAVQPLSRDATNAVLMKSPALSSAAAADKGGAPAARAVSAKVCGPKRATGIAVLALMAMLSLGNCSFCGIGGKCGGRRANSVSVKMMDGLSSCVICCALGDSDGVAVGLA